MNPRTIARILLAVVLVFGAIGIGVVAYNAGVAHGAAAQVVSDGGNVVVAPGAYAVAPYAGWGWGWGFGNIFFGFFGFLIFLFLFFGLLRLADDRRPGRLTTDSPSLPFTAPGPDRDPAPARP